MKKKTLKLGPLLKKLKLGETIVALTELSGGYLLFIGDELVNMKWAVTLEEMRRLKNILNKHREI